VQDTLVNFLRCQIPLEDVTLINKAVVLAVFHGEKGALSHYTYVFVLRPFSHIKLILVACLLKQINLIGWFELTAAYSASLRFLFDFIIFILLPTLLKLLD
jgi:hypothetical protein